MIIADKLMLYNKYINTFSFCTRLTTKLVKKETTRTTGKWVKEQLIFLGPTYVKIGQIVSNRTDIFPDYITHELSALQNDVPSFPYNDVKDIFASETSHPIEHYFESFEHIPFAAASIGQVHIAKLKKSRRKVVVKVQRPHIKTEFEKDFMILNDLFWIANIINNRTVNDIVNILNETITALYEEFDFENETNNILIFNKILEQNKNIRAQHQ